MKETIIGIAIVALLVGFGVQVSVDGSEFFLGMAQGDNTPTVPLIIYLLDR